ncbi:Myb-like DNA-binding domain containing protein [Tritrichomonas foetus]|uniref:Myb-like DNA-binding domain containing protein n=1 Tax=Tritrichomonas foetus TaxID=1144522 RepID=A0A1J4J391_9EUKA|nr:Myb-like DNA-binding domain containing protein [Tritrichomonas foetus]|eukprot:OHS93894.1 Myb-like DNA-binding domain containing protein [Tritrichomonas foetus]
MLGVSQRVKRRKFTEEEDNEIIKQVKIIGARKWELIAKFVTNRTAKQCRDRYQNYLAQNFFYGEWTKDEDLVIIRKINEIGQQWSVLSGFLKNRTPNAIKNRANFLMKSNEIEFTNNNHVIPECEKFIDTSQCNTENIIELMVANNNNEITKNGSVVKIGDENQDVPLKKVCHVLLPPIPEEYVVPNMFVSLYY